jgi:hypothetical protein
MISTNKPQLQLTSATSSSTLGVFCAFAQLRASIVASIKRRCDRVGELFVTLV